MKAIALIPARGGSKRIPRKNILDFAGKPMIAWSIEAALNSDVFDEVIVSTDNANSSFSRRLERNCPLRVLPKVKKVSWHRQKIVRI